MQPYPNYYPQNNYYNPMANPQQRMAQLEQQYQQYAQPSQYQPQMQIPFNQTQGIIGKIVNDFSEITANDVPMSGGTAFFPKADGSEMQARSWTPNGTIQTVVYRPVQEENKAEGTNISQNDFNALNEQMRAFREDITERLDRMEKSIGNTSAKSAAPKAKRGDAENE